MPEIDRIRLDRAEVAVHLDDDGDGLSIRLAGHVNADGRPMELTFASEEAFNRFLAALIAARLKAFGRNAPHPRERL
ncbi:MAG TPA: hypothetical protein VNP95_12625, partial [Thermomicrobiales bacterium]|nr:hypothetical protein [Thermomicrobiales bacterium]